MEQKRDANDDINNKILKRKSSNGKNKNRNRKEIRDSEHYNVDNATADVLEECIRKMNIVEDYKDLSSNEDFSTKNEEMLDYDSLYWTEGEKCLPYLCCVEEEGKNEEISLDSEG